MASATSTRPEKRQRTQAFESHDAAARSKITRAQGATSVKAATLGASLSERDCLDLSLTNLHWLCDLRLTGGIIPSEVPGHHAAAKAERVAPTKPEHSYAELISLAMQASPKKALTLNEIYNFVMERFPYYRTVEPSWKNSIRYNLSQNKLFTRLPTDGIEKAASWTLAARLQAAPAAPAKSKKGAASSKKMLHHSSKLAICEAAGDDWEDIEDVTPLASGLADPAGSDDDWLDSIAADGVDLAVVGAAVQHPWADEKCVTAAPVEPAPRGSSVVDANFAASLASCLSIFPLSASALAAESMNGGWELALGAGAAEAGRLPDVGDDGPIPRDWL